MATDTAPTGARQGTAARRPPRPTWRVVAEGGGGGAQGQAPRFAVYRGARRVAWGLSSHAAAVRWIARLGGTLPLEASPTGARGATRVWWGDGGT